MILSPSQYIPMLKSVAAFWLLFFLHSINPCEGRTKCSLDVRSFLVKSRRPSKQLLFLQVLEATPGWILPTKRGIFGSLILIRRFNHFIFSFWIYFSMDYYRIDYIISSTTPILRSLGLATVSDLFPRHSLTRWKCCYGKKRCYAIHWICAKTAEPRAMSHPKTLSLVSEAFWQVVN